MAKLAIIYASGVYPVTFLLIPKAETFTQQQVGSSRVGDD